MLRLFVAQEIGANFPLLSGQLTVALWANLETFVLDFARFLIASEPVNCKPIQDLKLSISDYLTSSESDRSELFLEALAEKNPKATKLQLLFLLLPGLREDYAKFSDLGTCIEDWRSARHQLAHRTGSPDKRFAARHRDVVCHDSRTIVSNEAVKRFEAAGLRLGSMVWWTYARSKAPSKELIDALRSWLEGNEFMRPEDLASLL